VGFGFHKSPWLRPGLSYTKHLINAFVHLMKGCSVDSTWNVKRVVIGTPRPHDSSYTAIGPLQ